MRMLEVKELQEAKERAILVGIEQPNARVSAEASLDELARLVDTVGADVVGRTVQRLDSPNPRTFVGSGKAEEIAQMCRAEAADLVVFDDELSPSQQANLEKVVGKPVKVIDRTALILDIFALHASTKEGRLQVRLAQNEYLYPRLRGMWAHLASNRMGGGVGSRFGEGESQLEVDRRMVRKRISSIKAELKKLDGIRATQREGRKNSGVFKITLAGYTNAGKSSLINALTAAQVLSQDKLFATLDSTTRRLKLPEGREVVLTDTIGFIRKLPTTLIESFKSTLDEINEADLVLHVIDSSSPDAALQIETVEEVLQQIGAQAIERIDVFNKADALDETMKERLRRTHPQAVLVSALTGEGIDLLMERIAAAASARDVFFDVVVPYDRGDMIALAHRAGYILNEEHQDAGTHLQLYIPHDLAHRFREFAGGEVKEEDSLRP